MSCYEELTAFRRVFCHAVGLAIVLAPARVPAQLAALNMPARALASIASDFDGGRNLQYCYFGARDAQNPLSVRVDSINVVDSLGACDGIGLGFITRIEDHGFLARALKGLIDASPGFVVVSAFYRTEDVESASGRVHTARAMSIVRGVSRATVMATALNRKSRKPPFGHP